MQALVQKLNLKNIYDECVTNIEALKLKSNVHEGAIFVGLIQSFNIYR
jgi:hypothetical protein